MKKRNYFKFGDFDLRIFLVSIFLYLFSVACIGQNRFATLDSIVAEMAKKSPGLDQKVEASVNGVSIQEFVRGIAISNNLDITIDPALNINVINSFSNTTAKDILLFLCKQYDLDLTLTGNIITIAKYKPAIAEKKDTVSIKKIILAYDKESKLLSYNLKNDSLYIVLKDLTVATEKNYVLPPGLYKKIVSGYIQNMALDNALDMLAYSNNLKIKKTGNSYLFDEIEASTTDASSTKSTTKNAKTSQNKLKAETPDEDIQITIDSMDRISIVAEDLPIIDVLNSVSKKMGVSYFVPSEIKGNTSVNLVKISFDDLLDNILGGTDYTYKMENGYYLFGKRDMEGLRQTKIIKLNYRSVENISKVIPADISKAVEVKEFPELNSLIVSGSKLAINEIDSFIFSVDKIVPVILIEVLIVEAKTSHTVATGIAAGLLKDQTTPVTTSGDVFPSVNVTMNSTTINSIINSLNGFGWINLGKVTSQFFMSLQAMEDEGIIKVNSTPKLATLNGNEATLSIGNTEYYLEETSNLIANQSTQNITTKQYKSINADLTLTIKPFVSGNEQITLNIDVKQSDFTARISPNAPPGSVTRSFSSLIRVKNEEMVLLGGLEKNVNSSVGSGVPFLARIPIIKWFFSSQKKEKSKSKLNIFIKPTIVY